MDYLAGIKAVSSKRYISEDEALKAMEAYLAPYKAAEPKIMARARRYFEYIKGSRTSLVQNLVSQYPLKTPQGYAIMSLAECLDRVPDKETAYELIDDKIKNINWGENKASSSLVMNTVAQALGLASKMGGNKLTYSGLKAAFKMLGKEFILGEDMDSAVGYARSLKKQGYHISYDMLGEGARSSEQAEFYLKSYLKAAESAVAGSGNIFENDSISIKISAIHPRYELLKHEHLKLELLPRLKEIVALARSRNIAVIIDAEEASRLDVSLMVFSELYLDDKVRYEGLGLAVQAYQKRALPVLSFLKDLYLIGKTRIPVRLVKGAYWDYEIKRAQADGLKDYPVYTQKHQSDLSYLGCAKYMLDNPDVFYPQFATHNVLTIAAIHEMAGSQPYESQKLYGMGDEIYDALVKNDKIKCRVYAPVGEQKDLLAYLIRRLLENGANNSFVHQLALAKEDYTPLLKSPFLNVKSTLKKPHEIFNNRKNSSGYDLGSINEVEVLKSYLEHKVEVDVKTADAEACTKMISSASNAFNSWNRLGANERANILEKIADSYEKNYPKLLNMLVYEARRNIADSISEVREAVDFCRYYAEQARLSMQPRKMQSITGEDNIYSLEGRGVFVCISPWNFPLAIFTGQIVAALAAGNCVVAKPAEQTPRVASFAIKLMHEAGIPQDVLHLAIGSGSKIGSALTGSPHISGVCFTGSTETARNINKSIVANNPKIIPFIAETGGQNCMVVDSTALIERTVDDMIISAFGSAGQRCSALRIAYVHEEIADRVIETLKGAMAEIKLGKVNDLSVDVGEVIDAKAKAGLFEHIERMKKEAKFIAAVKGGEGGDFVPPHLFEIRSIEQLPNEVFGPVLHLIRYSSFEDVISQVNSTGYGLTFGVQTRIMSRIHELGEKINAGNIYANRSMIGAVVESQPFGGHGLSGTGPKAGGPEYLKRFCVEKVVTNNKTAIGGNLDLM